MTYSAIFMLKEVKFTNNGTHIGMLHPLVLSMKNISMQKSLFAKIKIYVKHDIVVILKPSGISMPIVHILLVRGI